MTRDFVWRWHHLAAAPGQSLQQSRAGQIQMVLVEVGEQLDVKTGASSRAISNARGAAWCQSRQMTRGVVWRWHPQAAARGQNLQGNMHNKRCDKDSVSRGA
jgi:hypothetical protein